MQSMLSEIRSDESLLLLYAADELPRNDREQLEARLEREPALRAQLEAVQALHQDVAGAMTTLDGGARLPVSEGVAVRKVARVMRQWQIDRMTPKQPEEPADQLRFPWWSYPVATAAAILLAFIVWWGAQDGPPQQRNAEIAREMRWGGDRMYLDWDTVMEYRLSRSLWDGYEAEGLHFDDEPMASANDDMDDVDAIFMIPPPQSERTW